MIFVKDRYDLIIIGGGPGGYVAAIRAARAGLDTALIEKDRLGGTCLNRGCIPAKAMIHASEVYKQTLEAERFGVHVKGASYDYGRILEYKQETIDQLVGGIENLLKANGVDVIDGTGKLISSECRAHRIQVVGDPGSQTSDDGSDTMELTADNVVLATGSRPAQLPVPGAEHERVLDSDGLFALEHAPHSLVIIGGGVIGVEFATVFSNLGCKVTIIEALPKILDNFDKEISQNLKMILKKRGVDIHCGATVREIRKNADDALTCVFTEKENASEVTAEYILCATGRSPVIDGAIDEGLISSDGRFLTVDENCMTSVSGIYAIGDITGGIQLAHAASAQGIRAVEHIVSIREQTEQKSSITEGTEASVAFEIAPSQRVDVIPGCVYSDPEIAQVGMSEAEAKENGIHVRTGKFIMSANGKSLVTREDRGFIKVVADADTEKILGAQMMCARATDMIGEFTDAITNELTASDMLRSVRPHPTYSEGIGEALEDLFGGSTHTAPRKR